MDRAVVVAVEVGIKLLPKGFQVIGARVETKKKNKVPGEVRHRDFLFIPEGEILGICVWCTCTHSFGVSA